MTRVLAADGILLRIYEPNLAPGLSFSCPVLTGKVRSYVDSSPCKREGATGDVLLRLIEARVAAGTPYHLAHMAVCRERPDLAAAYLDAERLAAAG